MPILICTHPTLLFVILGFDPECTLVDYTWIPDQVRNDGHEGRPFIF